MDDLPTTWEFMYRMAAIENELMIERQAKQDLQKRLASLQTTTASLIAALPGTASGWFFFEAWSEACPAFRIQW
jgi:hypothetical protein